MNKPKRTSIHQMLAEQKEVSIPEQPAELQLLEAFENARDAAEYLGTLVRKDFEEVDSIHLTEAQIAEQNAFVKQLMGGFDEDEPTPAPTPPLSTCAIAPTSTGHKLTLQVESDADLHSLTTWLLGCLESLPAS